MSLADARSMGTGVGVLDRAVAIMDAVEAGSRTFTALVRATGLSRSTTHRLLKALTAHGLLALDDVEGYRLGPRVRSLAASLERERTLRDVAHPVLERLAGATGESAQLFARHDDARRCIDAVESGSELRTIVPVGATLPLTAGSGGKVLLAWETPEELDRLLRTAPAGRRAALEAELPAIRARGWASSSGEREPGVASVSAPVLGPGGAAVAAVSISGPQVRLTAGTLRRLASEVVRAARQIERASEDR